MASAGSMRTSTAQITPSSPASPRAGRQLHRLGPRPLVANDRLRHILIGLARISKAGSSPTPATITAAAMGMALIPTKPWQTVLDEQQNT